MAPKVPKGTKTLFIAKQLKLEFQNLCKGHRWRLKRTKDTKWSDLWPMYKCRIFVK